MRSIPRPNWINPDVIGIDLGITLLSAENARSGNVWRWFMANPEIEAAMRRAGFEPAAGGRRAPPRVSASRYELVEAPEAAADQSARAALGGLGGLVDRFEAHTFAAPGGTTLPYRLLRPATPPAGAARAPLVLVLHGSGEIGTDNRAPAHAAGAGLGRRRGPRPRRRLRRRAADAGAIGQLLGPADR